MKKKTCLSYIAAFFIPLFICVLICIGNGVYPFGSNCILHVDMYHQYCPFFVEFMNKLKSGSSLMYSWNLGLGSDFVSLYAYYLASPLNWLLILCPKGLVIEFMTLMIFIKIGAAGWSFFYFLKENDRLERRSWKMERKQVLPALVFSTAYALSGFMAAYSWNIMWLDVVALTPLAMIGLKRMVYEKKPLLYYLSLAVCIWSNYYMAIMLCMMLFFYFILLLIEKKGNRIQSVLRFGYYSILAGGTSAVLLLPEMKILSYSGSSGFDFPETVEWYFNLITEISRFCTAAQPNEFNGSVPNLYAGAFSIFLLVLYVLNREISWKKKLPRLGMAAFFLVSFANNYLDFIWHGLHFPDSLPGRQSFLYIFLLLVLGYTALQKWRGIRLWHVLAAIVFWCAALSAGMYLTDQDITDHRAFIMTGMFVICYGIMLVLAINSNQKMRGLIIEMAFVVAICELAANMALTGLSTTDRAYYLSKMEDYQELVRTADERSGGDFYRMEDTGRKTKNDGALYGYASTTQFSSLMDINISHFFQSVYMEGGKNYYCYNGATPVLSAMLSVRYIFSESPAEENFYRKLVGRSGSQYLYENTYCLPIAYMLPDDLEENWENSSDDKIASLNDLGYALGETEDMITEVDARADETAGSTTLFLPEEGYYFAAYDYCNSDTLTVRMGGMSSKKFSKTTHQYIIELGYTSNANSATITNEMSDTMSYTLYRMNTEVMESVYNKLSQHTLEIDNWSDTGIEGHIDIEEQGLLMFTIPAEDGWKIYVDGEEMPLENFKEAFLAVTLEEGRHEIRISYRTPYLIEGAEISLGCVILFVLSMLLEKYFGTKKKRRFLVQKSVDSEGAAL